MITDLKIVIDAIIADFQELMLPLPVALDLSKLGTLWDCVAEFDRLAIAADNRGYGLLAERYRRASRNLKPALIRAENRAQSAP